MVASPTYTNDLEQLMLDFEDAQADVVRAEAHVSDTQLDLLSVKAQLETAKAEFVSKSVEGKTLLEKEAKIRLHLHEQYQELYQCECELNRAKLRLSTAQTTWNTLRYKLRALETLGNLKDG